MDCFENSNLTAYRYQLGFHINSTAGIYLNY